MYLMAKTNLNLPDLAILTIETRPEYVDIAELEFLARALEEGDTPTELELAVGFEALGERIRNDMFNKGLRLETFEGLVRKIAPYRYRLKCYFMQKPVPGMSDEEAVLDIAGAIAYLSDTAHKHGVRINMHLNPTFVAFGTPLEQSFRNGEYTAPRLIDVARAALHAETRNISVFIGLHDEGLAVEGCSFLREGETELVPGTRALQQDSGFQHPARHLRRARLTWRRIPSNRDRGDLGEGRCTSSAGAVCRVPTRMAT